jgi:hypothetical protein
MEIAAKHSQSCLLWVEYMVRAKQVGTWLSTSVARDWAPIQLPALKCVLPVWQGNQWVCSYKRCAFVVRVHLSVCTCGFCSLTWTAQILALPRPPVHHACKRAHKMSTLSHTCTSAARVLWCWTVRLTLPCPPYLQACVWRPLCSIRHYSEVLRTVWHQPCK